MTTLVPRQTASVPPLRLRPLGVLAWLPAALALLLPTSISAGCGGSPSSPSDQTTLTLTASITSSVVRAGETAMLTFRLQNTGSTQMSLTFADGCQILPYIDDGQTGQTVYPDGGWGCTLAITHLVLPPGGEKTVSVSVGAAGSTTPVSASLPAGTYVAYAELKHSTYPLRSKSVGFKVE